MARTKDENQDVAKKYWLCVHGLEIRQQCEACDLQFNLDLKTRTEKTDGD